MMSKYDPLRALSRPMVGRVDRAVSEFSVRIGATPEDSKYSLVGAPGLRSSGLCQTKTESRGVGSTVESQERSG